MNLNTLFCGTVSALAIVFSSAVFAGHSVNINTASSAELADALDGVGQSRGQAIVEFRETYGNFTSAEALTQVKGVGLKTVERNFENIKISPVVSPERQQ